MSVVVTAGGSPADLGACLDSLQPSLGIRDEVVCVLPAHRSDLRDTLRGRTWVRVLDDDSGDQGARWSAGCDATSRPVVVLLDGDVVVFPHWLDPVLGALEDPAVVAAGPRCHLSFGPQRADLPDEATESLRAFKAHARQWRQENAGRFTDVDRLGPVCVAIRRDALERAGGARAELPYDRLRAQGRLVVADAVLVAHVGSKLCSLVPPAIPDDAPLLSACMIVKDEEDVLAEALTAVREFVDEIVVYDTGSTDRTREIAHEHGARVIEGYWNDHFGDARNRSLAHCTGQWILWVDADEVITGDLADARARLSAAGDVNAFLIGIQSITDYGTGLSGRQLQARLFRRNRLTWTSRLHEQGVDRVTGSNLLGPELPGVTLVHSGYTLMRTNYKNKGERNVRLARLGVEDQSGGPMQLQNLARSQLADGKFDDAIETCTKGLERIPRDTHRVLLKPLVQAYERSGRLAEAREALTRLRELDGDSATVEELEARLRLLEGDFAGALEVVAAIPENAMDDMLATIDEARIADIEISALVGLGRHHDAAERLRDCVRQGWLPKQLPTMAAVLTADGSGVAELAELLPRKDMRGLILAASVAPDPLADEMYEALWCAHGAPMILAGAARLGPRLPVLRAMEWSARLRQHGLAEHCTLLALASEPTATPRERVLAAAVAVELFSDDRAMPLLEQALGAVPEAENDRVLEDLRLLAPSIAEAVEPAHVG